LLTEQQIARSWRVLFHNASVDEETIARAEALLDELTPESPLRHRLEGELHEIRRLHRRPPRTKQAVPKKVRESDSPGGGEGAGAPTLIITWDPEILSEDDYAQLITALGDIARAEGGIGIKRLWSRAFGVPVETGVRV
jgi:hypothetical protein